MDVKDIKRLLDVLAKSDVREVTLETGDYKLNIKRGAEVVYQSLPVQQGQAAGFSQVQSSSQHSASPGGAVPATAAATALASAPNSSLVEVVAPIVGTFYSAPSPDAPAYVRV